MTTLTKAEKLAEKEADQLRAYEILDYHAKQAQNEKALFLITQEFGKGATDFLRVAVAYIDKHEEVKYSHLTWAIAKVFGYSLRTRNGYHYLAINGGGYSKPNEIARTLATFYGVPRVRYELN